MAGIRGVVSLQGRARLEEKAGHELNCWQATRSAASREHGAGEPAGENAMGRARGMEIRRAEAARRSTRPRGKHKRAAGAREQESLDREEEATPAKGGEDRSTAA